mgnify:CR=1 FL=1
MSFRVSGDNPAAQSGQARLRVMATEGRPLQPVSGHVRPGKLLGEEFAFPGGRLPRDVPRRIARPESPQAGEVIIAPAVILCAADIGAVGRWRITPVCRGRVDDAVDLGMQPGPAGKKAERESRGQPYAGDRATPALARWQLNTYGRRFTRAQIKYFRDMVVTSEGQFVTRT